MFDRPCAAHTMGRAQGFMFVPGRFRRPWDAASRAQGCVLAPSFPLIRFASLHGQAVG